MPKKKSDTPNCDKLHVIRLVRDGRKIVSTTALYDALGPITYGRVVQHFEYDSNAGPAPLPVEKFLATDPECQKLLKKKGK